MVNRPVTDPGDVRAPGEADLSARTGAYTYPAHEDHHRDDAVYRERPQRDRVRWGPVFAGLVTTLASFVVLQLIFVATNAVEIDFGGGGDTSFSFWTAISAIAAFFIGGLVAGASSRWDRTDDSMLQGIVMWSLATVGLVLLAGISAGALAGALGDFIGSMNIDAATSGTNQDELIGAAQERAAQALLSLALALGAAVAGSALGNALWPRRRHLDDVR